MTAERWARMKEIFGAALDKPEQERKAYLESACHGDAELRAEVERLLAEEGHSDFHSPISGMLRLASDLSKGTMLGNYRIEEKLGEGGMGTVFRALDSRLNRQVAIKVMAEPFRGRFHREAESIARLNHPNVCTLYDVGADYLVMELVEGPTLAERIAKGPLPLEDALGIARQIGEALEAAHEKGIVHRDLKPANIKLRADGSVKVLDFGLAKTQFTAAEGSPEDSPTLTGLTQPGMILGTAAYMCPEQASGKPVDKRADIWAYGVVLWEMLTGRRLFEGETVTQTLAGVLRAPIEFERLPGETPAGIRQLLRRCLDRDPKTRLRDIGEARVAINSQTGETAVLAPPPHRPSRTVWTVAAVLLAAAGFGLWKLSAWLAAPAPRVLRLAVPIPSNQAFVDVPGNSVVVTHDGSAIVYSGRGPHQNQLYYRRLDQLEGTALPGTEDSCCLAVSPSGEWVAFESASKIRKVSVHGGPPIELAEVSYEGGISWGPDDAIYSAEGEAGLFRIPAVGGPSRKIAAPDPAKTGRAWFMPLALPNGKTVLVFAYKPGRGAMMTMVRIAEGTAIGLDGDAENPIGVAGGYLLFGRIDGALGVTPFDPARTRSVEAMVPVVDAPLRINSGVEAALTSRGDLVYVKAHSLSRIAFLDAQGHSKATDPDQREFAWHRLRVSPDGRTAVISELSDNNRHSDLWLYDIASGARQPVTTGGGSASGEWTPDGRRILYRLAGPSEAWSVPSDRSAPPERFLDLPIRIADVILSPDSRYAVVTAVDPKIKLDLYLVDLKGDQRPLPLEQSPYNKYDPVVSPDGRWLAYASDESGREEVYIRPFPVGGAHVQVSANGGSDPRWEKDSRGIVYRDADRFMKASLAADATISVTQRDVLFTGTYGDYDLLPNGDFLVLRPGSADAEIIVATNWLAELKVSQAAKR